MADRSIAAPFWWRPWQAGPPVVVFDAPADLLVPAAGNPIAITCPAPRVMTR